MKKRQYARKPAPDTSVMSAGNLLQTRPFQADNSNQQAPQVQKESEALTGGFDLTKQYLFNPPTTVSGQPLQAKLTIGQPNDKYEQEADRVAQDVVQRINAPSAEQTAFHARTQDGEAVRRKQVSNPDDVGGVFPNTFESTLNHAKSGGQPLKPKLRTKLEGAMGANFGEVKIHTDTQADQLNHSIQAKAFTTGQDIFFRKGAYTPDSNNGQELIAHELTHVIQQQAVSSGTAKQQTAASVNAVNAAMLQRKPVVVNDKAHDRLLQSPLSGTPKEQLKAIEKGKQKNLYKKGGFVQISDTDTDHVKDEAGNIAWYRVQGSEPLYIRASKIFNVSISARSDSQGSEGEDLLGGFNEQIVGTTGGSLEDFSKEAQEAAKKSNTKADTSDLDIAKGSFDLVGGIMGMAVSIKNLVNNNERGLAAWIETLWNSVASLGKTTSGVSSVVSNASEEASKTAKDSKQVADWSAGVSGAMSTLFEGIKTIKSVVDLIKMVASDDKYSTNEYAKQGSEIVAAALGTAKGVVEGIKSFIEIFDGAVGGLAQAVPGLDIAISATQTIVQGYYLAISAHQWRQMSKSSKELTTNFISSGKTKEDVDQAKKTYQQKRAGVTNLEARQEEKIAKNRDRKQKIRDLTNEKKALEKERGDLLNEQSGNPTPKRKKEIDKRLKAIDTELNGSFWSKGINKEIEELTNAKRLTEGKIDNAKDRISQLKNEISNYESQSGITQVDLEELELSDELVSGNRKRVIRQSIHISTNAAKIAGSIATLAGASAAAGVALKASAAGVDISLPFVRAIKQYGRNIAAKNQAKGETGLANKIFNADKSTLAKLEERKKHTVVILKLVNNLNDYLPLPTQQPQQGEKELALQTNAVRVEKYIRASGCEPKALYRANGKPEQQAKMLVEALYKREF